ncbi:MAG: virulence RhuM family protein [Elusimicrobia bacterium]|nr:virulence RhuM family protein [Elusimicrobiota bacterium]
MEEKNQSKLIIYQTETGETKINVRFQDETVWLSQQLIADLFQTTKQNISLHIKNIYEDKELLPKATVKEFLTVRKEGLREVRRKVEYYNLDMIISVGYRIKSKIATHFRQWATRHLREFIVKGFVLDDERLKNPDLPFDYFDELMLRIQDIRTSERRFYQKITDIYATSVDYDPTDEMSIDFFKTVQNKMHWAITGQTAAEIIHSRADSKKKNMGLTNWRGAKIRKNDAEIAKNYLKEDELSALNNLVEQYLIFAQGQAMRRIPMYMKDWIKKLDGFMRINERDILTHAGKISHKLALDKADEEYEKYAQKRQLAYDKKGNDFDILVEETKKLINKKAKKKKGGRKGDTE